MATSSKVQFKLDVLREKALESIEFRLAAAELRLASYDDDEALAQRVREWRARQEEKLSDVFRQLGDGGLDDYRLSKFHLDPIPEVNRYERRDAQREVERLREKRSMIVAKGAALVADPDGNIALTKTQLSEFFGL